jgi:hypothetical protein
MHGRATVVFGLVLLHPLDLQLQLIGDAAQLL